MLNRLFYFYRKLPHYLGHRASPMLRALSTPWHYYQSIPRHQDAPVIIYTMGKVGTITIQKSLLNAEVFFVRETHKFLPHNVNYPYASPKQKRIYRGGIIERKLFYPWLFRRPKVRVVTMVREPIGRLISIYLFTADWRFNLRIKEARLQTLLDYFPRLFEQDFAHPLVPGYFFECEIKQHLGIDAYQNPSPQDKGSVTIDQDRFSLLLMRLETPDVQKATALSDWINRPVEITRKNTANDAGYAHIYEEFKRRVRIPYRYAEAIYRSSFMQHFYTPEERAKFWQRWEPQLDKSIALPEWVENQLQKYHPPVADLPPSARL